MTNWEWSYGEPVKTEVVNYEWSFGTPYDLFEVPSKIQLSAKYNILAVDYRKTVTTTAAYEVLYIGETRIIKHSVYKVILAQPPTITKTAKYHLTWPRSFLTVTKTAANKIVQTRWA